MTKKAILGLLIAALVAFTVPAVAQVSGESSVRGNLSGTIYDATGAVVPGAKVAVTGPTGTRTVEADNEGHFIVPLLSPGFYSIKVEKQGFKVADVKAVEVATNRTTSVRVNLEPGAVSETVEVTAAAVTVDTASTAVGANLSDTFYQQIPTQRGVTGLFYASPGVASGLGTGAANPSIAGGTGLENQYVADGVNITDGAFGGIGVFSRVYGSLATGINLSFVKEVQVKTGGFEPQYGKSTGGVVQIVTKSGSRDYHGAVTGFFQPQEFEAARVHADDAPRFNNLGKTLHQGGFDVSGEIGGYVPGFRDNVFFFGSFNPSWTRDYNDFAAFNGIAPQRDMLGNPMNLSLGSQVVKTTAYNYAAKGTVRLSESHQVEASIFGDPSRTPNQYNGAGALATFSDTTYDQLAFGTRNIVGRYNGTLTPTWLLNASVSWGHNYLRDTPFAPDQYGIVSFLTRDPGPDQNFPQTVDPLLQLNPDVVTGGPGGGTINGRAGYCANFQVNGGLPLDPCERPGSLTLQGFGFLENTEGDTIGFNLDTSKTFSFGGEHTFSIGYRLDKSSYDGSRDRTGPDHLVPTINFKGDLVDDTILGSPGNPSGFVGLPQDSAGSIRIRNQCQACPLMWVPGFIAPQRIFYYATRGEVGDRSFDTDGTYHTVYVNDSWSPWKYLTLNLGLRWEQQYMQGTSSRFTYTGNWSPRIGVSVDPWGDRRTKIYTNFGRYNYAIPLDMAIRSLSNEDDIIGWAWRPEFTNEGLYSATPAGFCGSGVAANSLGLGESAGCPEFAVVNADGTLNWSLDDFHLVSSNTGNGIPASAFGPFVSLSSGTAIAPGTKMQYLDEWVVGFERDFGQGVIFSARYTDRRLKRAVEDIAGVSPEAYNGGVHQNYFITNPTPTTDLFINPIQVPYDPAAFLPGEFPAACLTDSGDPTSAIYFADVTDSFGNPLASPAGSTNTSVCVVPGFTDGVANYVDGHEPGDIGVDGVADGFVPVTRNYQAVEFEVNKAFSRNWQLRANWRIAKLKGNYEGAFRNDNGQSDPSISSLFDFVEGEFGQLGDQFASGYLNTDRRHVVNAFFSYVFDKTMLKGLTLGTGVRVETGIPINQFKAHPAYLNAGEIPFGGRGSLGRLPTTGQVDVHADYAFGLTEKTRLRFGVDIFNLANMKRQQRIDQNIDRSFGVPNADFQKPTSRIFGFQRPFYARAMVKFEF